MSDEKKTADAPAEGLERQPATPAAEPNKEPVAPVDGGEGAPGTDKQEETIGDALNPSGDEPADPQEDHVPLATHLEVKREQRALAKRVKELEAAAAAGDETTVTEGLDAITAEFPDVNPAFVKKLAATITAQAKKEAEKDVEERLAPVRAKEKAEAFNKRFDTHFANTVAAMPEYKDVVNKDVIKQLALHPSNAKKTLTQLIEETFGKFVTGKKPPESATPQAKNGDVEVDVDRAKKDPEYFKQVMKDPAMKKKYNESFTDRISSQL